MARILSISIRSEDEWVVQELQALGGPISFHVIEAVKQYLTEHSTTSGKPFWFVPGKDYSHLPIEERLKLVPFGYKDSEVG